MIPPELLLVAEAGAGIGLGHVLRIQALYEFALWGGIRPHVTVLGTLPRHARQLPFVQRQFSIGYPTEMPDVAIIDTKTLQPKLPLGMDVVRILDGFPAIGTDRDFYPHHYPTDKQWVHFGGPMYAPLRMQFTKWRRRKPRTGPLRAVLVALGGGDAAGPHLDDLGEIIAWLPRDVWICIYGGMWKVGWFKDHWGVDVTVCRTMEDSALMLKDFDLAITPASMTALELLCLGIPIMPYAVNKEQRRAKRGLEACDVTFPLTRQSFWADSWERERKSKNALDLVDGRGAERILTTLF